MDNLWYRLNREKVLEMLETDGQVGLTEIKSQARLEEYGRNKLKEAKRETMLQKIIRQLKDYLVLVLIGASIVSAFIGEGTDAIVIISIVIVNAILGIVQEGQAEEAMEALQKMSAPNARVVRDGRVQVVPAEELVPGDLVHLEAGDIVPADLRLLESINLKADESSLTGESVPTEKDASQVFDQEAGIGDRKNMCYMSSVITYGRAEGVVASTGDHTEMGRIAGVIQNTADEDTPLQRKLAELGKWLGTLCLAVCIMVFFVGWMRGGDLLQMFMVAVSLAVAAIPEGLPAVVTIVLAMGMKKMVERNAIVKRLLAVETLGCVSVICSDKTGTLTQNEMTVVELFADGNQLSVSGQGYVPEGHFFTLRDELVKRIDQQGMTYLLSIGVLCNDAGLMKKDGLWSITGDPTEAALVVAGAKAGFHKEALNRLHMRVAEIPFDSDRKMMTTFHTGFSELGNVVSFTKGAPDVILDRCISMYQNGKAVLMDDIQKRAVMKVNGYFANRALRVLAFAYKAFDKLPSHPDAQQVEKNMTFIGLMGMIDPARKEAAEAIRICREAGIKPVMITGDFRDTAVAIARDLDLMREGDGVLTGVDLDQMSGDDLCKAVEHTSVYARVSPEHKVKIVEALRKNGNIAAMTGDGVNDAMALKRADIGVSMGITGTDVAKGTADMVLTDDNFASIVSAVEEGRIIYSNIRKFVYFLLSCNVGEILIVFISILMGLPVPLLPIQLLWMNLVTDSFPALALGTEEGEPDIMRQKPRNANESIIDRTMVINIAVQSVALTVAVLAAFVWALDRFGLDVARTYAFATLIASELIRAFSCRSEKYSILQLGVFSNRNMIYATCVSLLMMLAVLYIPFLQIIFGTFALSINDWSVIFMLCVIPLLAGEMRKLWMKKDSKNSKKGYKKEIVTDHK